MKKKSFLLIVIVFLFISCQKSIEKENQEPTINRSVQQRDSMSISNYFYYYKGGKIALELNPQYVLAITNETIDRQELEVSGFLMTMQDDNKNKSLRQIQDFKTSKWSEIKLNATSETEYQKAIEKLKKIKGVQIVSPYFKLKTKDKIGVSNYFSVKLKSTEDYNNLVKMTKDNAVTIVEQDKFMPLWYILSITKNSKINALELANLFYESGLFEETQPSFVGDISICSADSNYADQWNLENTGQYGGHYGYDIDIKNAHTITKGNNIKIGIVDAGIQIDHPDLASNILQTYDAVTQTSPNVLYYDIHGGNHGTACAGIFGAIENNIGIIGVAPQCKILSASAEFGVSSTDIYLGRGINWCVQNGADVISNSWGGGYPNAYIDNAINNALTNGRGGKGCVVVFAAGNGNNAVFYPANSRSEIIAVGAMSPCGQRKSPSSCDTETTWGSNYGNELDVVAPGVLIPTTDVTGIKGYNSNVPIHVWCNGIRVSNDYPNQNYTIWFNGTSSACPQVAGIAALILSKNSNLTEAQVRDIIEATCTKIGNYSYTTTGGRTNGTWNNEMGYGKVSAYRALLNTPPFYSTEMFQDFQKTNCAIGYSGTWVTYTVPANKYVSYISLADANLKALNDLNTQGPIYANSWGSCTMTNNDFDMESDFTYISGSLNQNGNTISGNLTFTPNYQFSNGIAVPVASFRNDNYIPTQTQNFYSGYWLITITPSAEKRIMITWTGGGIAPPGNITINISYQI